jgi:hydrogenase maturation factor
MLKLGERFLKRKTFEDVGEVQDLSGELETQETIDRVGMDKNHRLAKVISVYNDGVGFRRVLFEIQEWAKDNDGEWYVGTYKLMVGVKRKVFLDIVRQLTHGDMVMVGYYVQSFQDHDDNKEYHTLVKLRSLKVLREDMAEVVGKSIWHSTNQHPLGFLGK